VEITSARVRRRWVVNDRDEDSDVFFARASIVSSRNDLVKKNKKSIDL
jgi:hypothetical protein